MNTYPSCEEISALLRSLRPFLLDPTSAGDVIVKNRNDFVTAADLGVQKRLREALAVQYPHIRFMGEEDADHTIDPAIPTFVLDPIDGTTNFIHDCRHSCISLALFSRGEAVFGAIYNPYLDELYHAEKGQGAFLNGRPIHVSDRPLELGILAFGPSPYYKDELAAKTFALCQELFFRCTDVHRFGSAALDLADLAAGRNDLFFEFRLSPWDIAAGYLLITEAGGIMTDMAGKPIDFSAPCPVIAANPTIYPALLEIVKRYC